MKRLFQCETCHTIFDTDEEALTCEGGGVPDARYDVGHQFGVWEVRSKRCTRASGGHGWAYEARAWQEEDGNHRYQRFSEGEIGNYDAPPVAAEA